LTHSTIFVMNALSASATLLYIYPTSAYIGSLFYNKTLFIIWANNWITEGRNRRTRVNSGPF
jgi:hypothetical protein